MVDSRGVGLRGVGLLGVAIVRRHFLILLIAGLCAAWAAAGLVPPARAQDKPAPTGGGKPAQTQTEKDVATIRQTFNAANTELQPYAHAPCLDPETRAKLDADINKAIKELDQLSIDEGKIFINTGETDASKAYDEGTHDSIVLGKELKFLLLLPNCGGVGTPKGGGGVTDGPSVTPYGPIPHSQTQIPPCLNEDAKQLIDVLKKRIPEDEQNIKDETKKMEELRQAIQGLLDQKARAAAANQNTGTIDVELTKDIADYSGAAWRLRTAEVRLSQNKEDWDKLMKLKPCPDDHGYYVPPRPGGGEQYAVSYTTDSTAYCTYTEATVTTVMVTWDPGTPGYGGTTPSPQPTDGPGVTPAPSQPAVAEKPKPVAPPPDQPKPEKTVELTPPAPDDTPSDIPDDVQLKVTQEVLEGGPSGSAVATQTLKLTSAEKPELPAIDGGQRAALDKGFDKPPAQCTTDANGLCAIAVRPSERATYHLPELAKGEHRTYHLAISRPQTSGGVAEITGRTDKIDPLALQSLGNKITLSTFRIGKRDFVRFSLATRYGLEASVLPGRLKEAYGPTYEEDLCQEKYPGGLMDAADAGTASTDAALPSATLKLDRRASRHGGLR